MAGFFSFYILHVTGQSTDHGTTDKDKQCRLTLNTTITCPVPVRRLTRPSRSIHFRDVSEAKRREMASRLRSDHMT